MYTEKELVGIAKRENNTKRSYLVVNKLQGKHVPAQPGEVLRMFDELASIVKAEYQNEKILLVGFAETATAIGARMAVQTAAPFMQTTRENVDSVEYLYFTESHSHATEQKLIKTDLDKIIDDIQRIVFVEDEVTTGNTIRKIIDIIERTYEKKIAFSVASILNGMDEASRAVYEKRNIKLHYLVKTEHSAYSEIAQRYSEDGIYHTMAAEDLHSDTEAEVDSYSYLEVQGTVNARRLQDGEAYQKACTSLGDRIMEQIEFGKEETVLVIGTEEFMYPAIWVAEMIAEKGCQVKTHATTRSPIAVSREEGYPLQERYELHSLYADDRRTFLYDLKKYDKVLIITDSQNRSDKGIKDLCGYLQGCGNSDIYMIRWCEA